MTNNFYKIAEEINNRINEIEKNNYYTQNEKIMNDIQNYLKDNTEKIYNKYLNQLNTLIGLEEVKTEIKKLINYLIFIKKTHNKINLENINLNMIFRGNPGTGKTTVAKIVANILCNLGFLKSNTVIETTPKDFIAEYVGQTAIKAKKTINSAKGGVIFIDEAYTFSQSKDESDHTFAYEAITEIIKEMEKLDTVFIFSGYEKEMNNFVELNPGIKSRIGYDIHFKDYTKEELLQMFNNKVNKSGMKLSTNANKILIEKIEESMTQKNFGNGRMIDNLFSAILREHATNNLFETDINKLLLITEKSIENIKIKTEGGMSFG